MTFEQNQNDYQNFLSAHKKTKILCSKCQLEIFPSSPHVMQLTVINFGDGTAKTFEEFFHLETCHEFKIK